MTLRSHSDPKVTTSTETRLRAHPHCSSFAGGTAPLHRLRRVPHRVVNPNDLDWITRPHEAGEPARHVAELSEAAGFEHTRANVWRYEPGAKGRRHRHPQQEETFVVLQGTLSPTITTSTKPMVAPVSTSIFL